MEELYQLDLNSIYHNMVQCYVLIYETNPFQVGFSSLYYTLCFEEFTNWTLYIYTLGTASF